MVSSPQKSLRTPKDGTFWKDAQTPQQWPEGMVPDSVGPAETLVDPMTPAASDAEGEVANHAPGSSKDTKESMGPPAVPTGREPKDALYWKFLSYFRHSGWYLDLRWFIYHQVGLGAWIRGV